MPIGVYQHKPLPLEQRLKISAALKGRVPSAEHRKNLSIALTGKKLSEETKRKMSASKKGICTRKDFTCSPETRAKMSASHKGVPMSAVTRENMRLACIRTKSSLRLAKGINSTRNKGIPQTEDARRRISESLKKIGHKPPLINGATHYNWKGGITPVNVTIRNSLKYKIWRNAVFSRDDWTCQKYKIRGGVLRAHHILSFHKHPELRLVVDNGVTLSRQAHHEFHNKYGRKNNTAAQLMEFLATPVPN